MNRIFLLLILLYSAGVTGYAQVKVPLYKDAKQPIDKRVEDLLQRMTPEEKFWQCFMIPGDVTQLSEGKYQHGIFGLQVSAGAQHDGAAGQLLQYNTTEGLQTLGVKINQLQQFFVEKTRLGIPMLPFDEALHGLIRKGATAFPQAIAFAASFDTTLVKEVAGAIATETKSVGIRQILSPVVNLANDVRWGRVEETYGEDPFLTTMMGNSFMKMFEQNGVITTPKHFVANVGEGGRDSYPIHWSERYLEETHLVPFKYAFQKTGSRSVMTAYNLVNGRPATASHWLLQQKLKDEWGFKGFVISDASAVGGPTVLHMTAKDYEDASAQAMNAGLDVIFQTEYDHYKLFMPPFLDGRIAQQRIDDAVRRVLRAKFELGLFEQPYLDLQKIVSTQQLNAHALIAEKAALGSMVLLKNKQQTLPILKQYKKILVVGEEAELGRLGGYAGPGNKIINLLDGIHEYPHDPALQIEYKKGVSKDDGQWEIIPSAYLTAKNQKGLTGQYFNNPNLEGNPVAERRDEHINFSWTLYPPFPEKQVRDYYSVRWEGALQSPVTGKYTIGLRGNQGFRLYLNDRLVIDQWNRHGYSTDTYPVELKSGQQYKLKIEFREMTGNAALQLIWNLPASAKEKEYQQALLSVKDKDLIIVAAGIEEGEFHDRALLSLPGNQQRFIKEAAKSGKPVVVILVGGSAITMTGWLEDAAAVLQVWYPGERGGAAIAKVLFGEVSPSGKLPVTFPLHEAQLPLTYNHQPTGRADYYGNFSGEPLFEFGYGMSYSTFEWSRLTVDKKQYQFTDTIVVACQLKNTGNVKAAEVAQLYVHDELATTARPVIELKGFQKIMLNPGETRTVQFRLPVTALVMLNEQNEWVVEPGMFRIMVGNSSKNLPLKTNIEVVSK
jgi:beta-glucosidase